MRKCKKSAELEQGERLDEDTIDFYQAQLDRIDLLAPSMKTVSRPGERLSSLFASRIFGATECPLCGFIAGDAGLTQQVDRLQGSVHELVQMDPDFESIDARLQSVAIEFPNYANGFFEH